MEFQNVEFSKNYAWKTQGRICFERIFGKHQDELEAGSKLSLLIDDYKHDSNQMLLDVILPLLSLQTTSNRKEILLERQLDFVNVLG
jgi:hypothetical protein